MSFLNAMLFLFAPLFILLWFFLRKAKGSILRAIVLTLILLGLSQPLLEFGNSGVDLIYVVDRSHSASEYFSEQEQILQLLYDEKNPEDRLAVISFSDTASLLQAPDKQLLPDLSLERPTKSGSNIAAALNMALALCDEQRSSHILLSSDGQATDLNPRSVAARAAQRKCKIDILPIQKTGISDAAIGAISLPQQLPFGNSFIGLIQCHSDIYEERSYRIFRNDKEIAAGRINLSPDQTQTLRFADRPLRGGIQEYRIELSHDNDREIRNNKAFAVVRVHNSESIMIMSGNGQPGAMSIALRQAGFSVIDRAEGPISLDELSQVQVLILDQVPADALSYHGMKAIERWVRDFSGGLLFCGGQRGFGSGGYYRSVIEDILPVSLEVRDQERKSKVAIAVTLDRSGSMSAPVSQSLTKMDLANEGTAAVVDMLFPGDEIAVHAVDSEAHVIIPMTTIENKNSIINKIMKINSQGGGIYTYNALIAAGQEFERSNSDTRHIVLFADANDAEQPDNYKTLLDQYTQLGITVSVIGLGTPQDSDARFLEDIAKRGNGRIHFTEAPEDLPRLFAQETMLMARNPFIRDTVAMQSLPALFTVIGQQDSLSQFPHTNGYNQAWAKEDARVLAWHLGDPQVPAIAAWRVDGGRSVALSFALDDANNAHLPQWPGYSALLGGLSRWASGMDSQQLGQLNATISGSTLSMRLELDPTQKEQWPREFPKALLSTLDGELLPCPNFQQTEDGVFELNMSIAQAETYLSAAKLGQERISGPALRIPYEEEFKVQPAQAGMRNLEHIAQLSNGKIRQDILNIFDLPPSPGHQLALLPFIAFIALFFFLCEIIRRRLQLRLNDFSWNMKRFLPSRPGRTKRDNNTANKKTFTQQEKNKAEPTSPTQTSPQSKTTNAENTSMQDALKEMKRRRNNRR